MGANPVWSWTQVAPALDILYRKLDKKKEKQMVSPDT